MTSEINHPEHYAGHHMSRRKYETWDVIQDWQLDYLSGNAVKYISRSCCPAQERKYDSPTGWINDIDKAIVYLQKKRAEYVALEEEEMDDVVDYPVITWPSDMEVTVNTDPFYTQLDLEDYIHDKQAKAQSDTAAGFNDLIVTYPQNWSIDSAGKNGPTY